MRRRTLGALVAAAVAAPGAAAWAAFADGVAAGPASLATYTVPTPTGIRCAGLASLTSSRIAWDAVTPPPGDTVDYVVTLPRGGTAVASTPSYALPAITLVPGQYAVQARIGSGWLSQPTTITVSLTALGLLYLCRVP